MNSEDFFMNSSSEEFFFFPGFLGPIFHIQVHPKEFTKTKAIKFNT